MDINLVFSVYHALDTGSYKGAIHTDLLHFEIIIKNNKISSVSGFNAPAGNSHYLAG